jgi:hypothetical protein
MVTPTGADTAVRATIGVAVSGVPSTVAVADFSPRVSGANARVTVQEAPPPNGPVQVLSETVNSAASGPVRDTVGAEVVP